MDGEFFGSVAKRMADEGLNPYTLRDSCLIGIADLDTMKMCTDDKVDVLCGMAAGDTFGDLVGHRGEGFRGFAGEGGRGPESRTAVQERSGTTTATGESDRHQEARFGRQEEVQDKELHGLEFPEGEELEQERVSSVRPSPRSRRRSRNPQPRRH